MYNDNISKERKILESKIVKWTATSSLIFFIFFNDR